MDFFPPGGVRSAIKEVKYVMLPEGHRIEG